MAAAADADWVTRLVLGWLAAKRSPNTRTAYARDIGITPQRRASRTPSWLTWCQAEGVDPVTGVTGRTWPGTPGSYRPRDCPRRARPASSPPWRAGTPGWPSAGTSPPARPPAFHGPGPPRAYPAAPGLTREQALALVHAADQATGPQRARTAALVALLLFTGARLTEVISADVDDLGTSQGRRVLWVTRGNGRRQGLPLPSPAASRIDAYLAGRARPGRRPGAVRHQNRWTTVCRRRAAGRAPPRHPGRPAGRPGQPAGTARDTALIRYLYWVFGLRHAGIRVLSRRPLIVSGTR